MTILRSILGAVFAVMAATAAIRGILLIVPVLTASGGGLTEESGFFRTGMLYLGISMEGIAIILAMLAYTCFRSRKSPSPKPNGADRKSQI